MNTLILCSDDLILIHLILNEAILNLRAILALPVDTNENDGHPYYDALMTLTKACTDFEAEAAEITFDAYGSVDTWCYEDLVIPIN